MCGQGGRPQSCFAPVRGLRAAPRRVSAVSRTPTSRMHLSLASSTGSSVYPRDPQKMTDQLSEELKVYIGLSDQVYVRTPRKPVGGRDQVYARGATNCAGISSGARPSVRGQLVPTRRLSPGVVGFSPRNRKDVTAFNRTSPDTRAGPRSSSALESGARLGYGRRRKEPRWPNANFR